MEMTIKKSKQLLSDYQRLFNSINGDYKLSQVQASELSHSICTILDIIHKYQMMECLINQAEYAGENSDTGEGEWILADKIYQKIQEISKNGIAVFGLCDGCNDSNCPFNCITNVNEVV
jgi:hypothetical protein